MLRPREARGSTIALFLAVQTVLVTLLVTYRMELLVPIARATGWFVQVDLLAGAILFVLVVGGILLRLGGLRLSDVGLVRAHLPHGVAVTVGFWITTQGVLVLASLLEGGPLVLHPQWEDPGVRLMLTFLVAMLLGTPLYEEVAFRGFLFPQLFLKLRATHRVRVWGAAIASAVVFALVHIPTRFMVTGVTASDLLPHLAVLTLAGLFGVVLYLRTRNLLVVTGIHALVNAPTQLVTAPISPFMVTAALSVLLWVAWPRLVPHVREEGGRGPPVDRSPAILSSLRSTRRSSGRG